MLVLNNHFIAVWKKKKFCLQEFVIILNFGIQGDNHFCYYLPYLQSHKLTNFFEFVFRKYDKTVAIKVIKNNKKYRDAAKLEIEVLQQIKAKDPDNKQ